MSVFARHNVRLMEKICCGCSCCTSRGFSEPCEHVSKLKNGVSRLQIFHLMLRRTSAQTGRSRHILHRMGIYQVHGVQ